MRLALVLLIAIAACKKGDPVKCDTACRNYAQLKFWHQHEPEIAAASPEQRDAVRQKLLADFTRGMERGLDLCTTKCVDANYDKDVTCWTNAKTYDQLHKCDD
jgi:hypothetical protein